MKLKYIITSILAAGIAASGCTEIKKIDPETYQASLFLQSSDSKIVFDKEGGKAIVTMATNAESWSYTVQSGDWFAVSDDADCLVVEAPVNSGSMKTDDIKVAAVRDDETKEVTLKIIQRSDEATNLSADGTANCYIAPTNGTYKFRADIKGNGGKDGKSKYIEAEGLEIEDGAYAELLWEARNDGDRTMSYEIIDGTPSYNRGYISFSTGRSEGNALIAVKNAKGKVLWSWHIWVTNNDLNVHDHIGPEGKVIAQIMDRNLGALNNTPMDIDNRGMIYQMGRKDPFIPSRSPYADYSDITDYDSAVGIYCANKAEWNKPNKEVGDGTGEWEMDTKFKAKASFKAPGNIPFASEHPMRFLVAYFSQSYSWYIDSSDEDSVQPGLWGEEKTIFDPCPPGYKVPGKNMWGKAVGDESIKTGGKHGDYDETGVNDKFLWNRENGCGRVWRPTGDFYPMAGNIYPSAYSPAGTTPYNYASGQTFYLTSQEKTYDSEKENQSCEYYVAAFNGYWALYETRSQVYSGQVRCVRE